MLTMLYVVVYFPAVFNKLSIINNQFGNGWLGGGVVGGGGTGGMVGTNGLLNCF